MTDTLRSIVEGTIIAVRSELSAGNGLEYARVLLVTPAGMLSRECYLDLTSHYHRQPALSELRKLALKTQAHVAVVLVPLSHAVLFYVECKDSTAWQGEAALRRDETTRTITLIDPVFVDGSASHFNPVLTLPPGVPVVSTHAG